MSIRGLFLAVCVLVAAAPSAASSPGVADVAVAFEVRNTNTSRVACYSDGRTYVVRGHLVAPSTADGGVVTVYQPGFGFTEDYWHAREFPDYDYAAKMAGRGHASLVYDPLGYGASDRPGGYDTCWGSDADVVHQIVSKLRSGDYRAAGASPVRFSKIVVASHYSSGLAAHAQAYSYGDADGLIVTSWASQNFSSTHLGIVGKVLAACAAGAGYTDVPPTEEEFRSFHFSNADAAVVDWFAAHRSPVPCGEPMSGLTANATDIASLGEITVPVLLVYGRDDRAFDQPGAGDRQRTRYAGSTDVSLVFIEGSGPALALERRAPEFHGLVDEWLCTRDFAGPGACAM